MKNGSLNNNWNESVSSFISVTFHVKFNDLSYFVCTSSSSSSSASGFSEGII